MKKISILALCLTLLASCKQDKQEEKKQEISELSTEATVQENTQEEWVVLFDGTDTEAWHEYGKNDDSFPESWKVEGGALVFHPAEGEKHNIVTDEVFESFELHIEWKISEAGNSGIMWGVQELEKYNEPYFTGPEIQVLDNEKHPDAKVNGKTHQAGALYDMVPPAKDVTSPIGEWNTYVIRIDRNNNQGSVTHNGELITEFPLHGEAWNAMVANSKFSSWEDFGKFAEGKIALQDHSDVVAYRNIKIKKL